MYRHLLVPVDHTELSSATVSKAVEFAGAINARITFMHVTPDYAATEEGALQIALSPEWFSENAQGDTHAVLAKAGAAATASGIVYDTYSKVCDRPYEAIVDAADSLGCDLIFMASRGYRGFRGLLQPSQTEKVVRHTRVPVLVSSVAANDPHAAANHALAIIEDEHRSLAVVIHGLLSITRDAKEDGVWFDAQLVRNMIRYLHAFPERLHHPKEEQYLFAPLRERAPDVGVLLDELETQHVREKELVAELERALDDYEAAAEGEGNLDRFSAALSNLANAIWNHMGKEEKQILPAARRYLLDEDWKSIAAAFEANGDPLAQLNEDELGKQFVKIANLLSQRP